MKKIQTVNQKVRVSNPKLSTGKNPPRNKNPGTDPDIYFCGVEDVSETEE